MILAVSSLVLYLTETDHFSIAGIVNAEKLSCFYLTLNYFSQVEITN